jgi:streptogramin lyase
LDNFGAPSGIAVDGEGRVWVSDAANNRLMRFTLP